MSAVPGTPGAGAMAEWVARAAQFGVPFVAQVDSDWLDPALVGQVPVEWSRRHVLLPIRWEGKLGVLTADPGNVAGRQQLAMLLGEDPLPVAAPPDMILGAIEACYFQRDESPSRFIAEMPEEQDALSAVDAGSPDHDLLAAAAGAPVSQLVNLILLDAIKQRASDIHFEPRESHLRVRYRVDGVLYEQPSPPRHMVAGLVSRLKVMAHMDIAERRLPQDGMTRVRIGGRECDIRVSTVPVAAGERVVLRLLDKDNALLPMVALGMASVCRQAFGRLIRESTGMVIVCGPTGSGKTTTLYAALGLLDASRQNILTVEDPIEYRLDDVGQIQVKPKIGLTFATGLRHILRQDPDVVLVGETRDLETAEIAIRAALTGHLVLTTLHTNDAPGAVVRLLDMGIDAYLVASCVRGVLAQRLVRTLCQACRRAVTLDDELARRLCGDISLAGSAIFEPVGCECCRDGFRGRTGLFELMPVDEAMRRAIHQASVNPEGLADACRKGGLRTLVQDGIARLLDGTTSASEVLRCAGV